MSDLPLINDLSFKRDAHARFAEMRSRGPIHMVTQPSGLEIYVVVEYELARIALSHADLGKDPRHGAQALDRAGVTIYQSRGRGLGGSMLMADPPDHTRLRAPVAKLLTPRRIEALRSKVQAIADGLLDAVEAKADAGEPIDLVADFTEPLPIIVLCELLGIAPDARRDFRTWSLAALAGGAATPTEVAASAAAALNQYLAGLLEAKRREPGDDLLSALGSFSDADDTALSEEELLATAVMLVVAGHETTVNLLGNAMAALLDQPAQAGVLRSRPELLPNAVEEFLRWDCPVEQTSLRFAVRDITLGGLSIPQGAPVMVALASVGRDAKAASEPDRLDVLRTDGRHISFGYGIHHCVGAPLARMEAVIALGTVLRRLPGLRSLVPYADLSWTPLGIMHGPIALPVSISKD